MEEDKQKSKKTSDICDIIQRTMFTGQLNWTDKNVEGSMNQIEFIAFAICVCKYLINKEEKQSIEKFDRI